MATNQKHETEKNDPTSLISPPLLVLTSEQVRGPNVHRYEVEVELTSSWEANLGLAGGDRDLRCGNCGWREPRGFCLLSESDKPTSQPCLAAGYGYTTWTNCDKANRICRCAKSPKVRAACGFMTIGTTMSGLAFKIPTLQNTTSREETKAKVEAISLY